MFSRLLNLIKQVVRKIFPFKDVETAERIETPLSSEMVQALDTWYNMYCNKADWLKSDTVKSLNLPAHIAAEMARQIVLEMKWHITAKKPTPVNGEPDAGGVAGDEEQMNPRAQYLKDEFERNIAILRRKLETGCAAGGMTIKPYPKGEHIYWDWTMDWALYPGAFGDDGDLSDVIFRDTYLDGKTVYTRLERHVLTDGNVQITQRAFRSNMRDSLGTEIPLSDVPAWAEVKPESTVENAGGQMFGWFKVASSNTVDPESPMGESVFHKAKDLIKEADMQYSRLLWEFEASELAIDVDPTVLRPKKGEGGGLEMPKLNQRLFRAVDADKGERDLYEVFSPAIRDSSLVNGLNQLLMRIEDLCCLGRGALSDQILEAKTATELKINRQRFFAAVADNQKALEACLRDVIRAMDKYATLYGLAPEGEYEVSFEWDDSILTDTEQQMNERIALLNSGIISKAEFRQWYFGETAQQAAQAIAAVTSEKMEGMDKLLPTLPDDDTEDTDKDNPKKKKTPKPPKPGGDINADRTGA